MNGAMTNSSPINKNIYRVYENQSGGDRIYSLPVTPAVLAGDVAKRIPGIARAVRFVDMEPQLLSFGDKQFLRSGFYADSGFFSDVGLYLSER